jgi:hypothetical protein
MFPPETLSRTSAKYTEVEPVIGKFVPKAEGVLKVIFLSAIAVPAKPKNVNITTEAFRAFIACLVK